MFKDEETGIFFSCLDKLYTANEFDKMKEEVTIEDITLHGSEIDDDPDGRKIKPDRFEIVWQG